MGNLNIFFPVHKVFWMRSTKIRTLSSICGGKEKVEYHCSLLIKRSGKSPSALRKNEKKIIRFIYVQFTELKVYES